MGKKVYLFAGSLLVLLTSLMLFLIYLGNKSLEYRENLFMDQASASVEEMISGLEEEYYCFDLAAEMSIPKLDSFYLLDPSHNYLETSEKVPLTYRMSDGQEKEFRKMPIMSPGHMEVLLRFEFDNIPEFRGDEELNDFEKWIRDSYKPYLYTDNGIRLIDTIQFDSLLVNSITSLYPEAEIRYQIKLEEDQTIIFENEGNSETILRADLSELIFSSNASVPNLLLTVEILNKDAMFSDEAFTIYGGALALFLLTSLIIFLFVRMYLQQKKLLKIQKDFVHGMTHEFNTPLSNIKLLSKRLSRSPDYEVQRSVSMLEEETSKLQVGLNLILTTALIEKDELLLQKENTDIKELLQKTIERNKEAMKQSGIKLEYLIPNDNLESSCDSFHVENVFQSMLNNVKKHSEANELKITAERNNGHVIVQFSDNGKGIEKTERDRIFDKFESQHKNGSQNGYGLGLYYSRMIMEMHGGEIGLEDIEKGSTFTIKIPA